MATFKKMSGTVEVPEVIEVPAEVIEVPEVEALKPIKYRYDFPTWEEYNNYKGVKA